MEEKALLNKKIIMLAILFVSVLAIAQVSAAENATDVVDIEDATEVIALDNENVADVNDLKNDKENSADNHEILGIAESQNNLSRDNGENILSVSSPYSSYYSVSVYDTTVNYANSGTIKININPCTYSNYYKYNFYLRIYDSNGNQKYNYNYYSSYSTSSISYTFNSGTYSPGTYTVKIVNYADSKVMDTATLTVKSSYYPSYSDYSVSVSDTTVYYGSGGSISMSISPSSKSNYKYYYHLKVYDSNGNQKISQEYYSTSSAYSRTYDLSSKQLSSGTYTVKIVNYADSKVMDTATLTVKSSCPSYSDYNVVVSDTTVHYGSGGSISMSISPASKYYYKYDYYLRVYDSNGNQKISQEYYSTSSDYSKTYGVGSTKLSPGKYTIKIVNYADSKVMDTATLIVKSKTDIIADDITTSYGNSKNMVITLKDSQNKLLFGKKVSVKLNGKTYSRVTDSYGQISVKIPNNLVPKTYVASVSFAGDDYYVSSSESVKVIVEKATTKISVKSVTGNSGKKVKLTAKVTDNLRNNIKKFKVTFMVNGKKYYAKTNSKGIATVKVKVPKSKLVKVSSKTKNKIVTRTANYKKLYKCTASIGGNEKYKSSSTKFKVTSKNKKIQKFRIVKKQTKTIIIPYKQWGFREKTSGHYIFGILHEQREGNRISVIAGDKTLRKYIKFSSNAYYINHGKKVYPWKWIKSKHNTDSHEYYYTGNAKIYVIIKYNAYTYKKI